MKKILLSTGCLALAAVVAALTGCNTESADSPISVSPNSVQLRNGRTAPFTASGGYDYTWNLDRNDLGWLNQRTGPTVVYTAYSDAVNTNAGTATVVLTVTSTVQGAAPGGGNNTNANANANNALGTAEAYIQHVDY
jgi:hypothetical protein